MGHWSLRGALVWCTGNGAKLYQAVVDDGLKPPRRNMFVLRGAIISKPGRLGRKV